MAPQRVENATMCTESRKQSHPFHCINSTPLSPPDTSNSQVCATKCDRMRPAWQPTRNCCSLLPKKKKKKTRQFFWMFLILDRAGTLKRPRSGDVCFAQSNESPVCALSRFVFRVLSPPNDGNTVLPVGSQDPQRRSAKWRRTSMKDELSNTNGRGASVFALNLNRPPTVRSWP